MVTIFVKYSMTAGREQKLKKKLFFYMDNYSVTKKSAREILLVGALNVVKRHHINQALPTL